MKRRADTVVDRKSLVFKAWECMGWAECSQMERVFPHPRISVGIQTYRPANQAPRSGLPGWGGSSCALAHECRPS